MGEQELENILLKLFEFGDGLIHSGVESQNTDDAFMHLPSFLTAFAQIIHQLPVQTLPQSHLRYIENYIRMVFLMFPDLFPKQKKLFTNVLAYVFRVLYLKGTSLQVVLKNVIPYALTMTCSEHLTFSHGKQRFAREQGKLIMNIQI